MVSSKHTTLLPPDWTLAFKNLVFPIFCKQCGIRILTEENGYFCPTCWESSRRIERPFCPVCGRPHPAGVGLGTRSNFRCGPCSTDAKRFRFRRVLGAAAYDGAVKLAIKLFKFYDKPNLAGPLGDLAREQAEAELECSEYDALIPVPLHRVRQRERGFNQAALLVERMLPAFSNATVDRSLERIRPTGVQSRLRTDMARKKSVRGAFALRNGEALKGKTVLLVDDVVTTGATANECSEVLMSGGVAAVDILAVALALPHSFDEEQ